MQIETDGTHSVRDERDEHDEHLNRARPVREEGPVVFERVQLALQVLVVVHHGASQRSSMEFEQR